MIPKEDLRGWADGYGIRLTDTMLEQLDNYAALLAEWNEKVNLTAITEPREIAIKHFLDSLLLLHACRVPQDGAVIDVGAGAGFPSMPMKVARPDIRLTLLDGLQKRIGFLEAASSLLGQENTSLHGRAEEAGRNPELRERFDLAAARAVAPLPLLCEYCLPLVKAGGIFAALKGPSAREELKESGKALSLLGGELLGVREYTLPGGSVRNIILIAKKHPTPARYPRHNSQIKKAPL